MLLAAVQAAGMFSLPATLALNEAGAISSTLGSKWILASLGFMVPILLSLVVVPLEYFFYTVRPVLGSVVQVVLHVLAVLCRVLGAISQHTGRVVVSMYDVVIFLPLLAEEQWQRKASLSDREQRKESLDNSAERVVDQSSHDDALRSTKTLSIIDLQSEKDSVPRH